MGKTALVLSGGGMFGAYQAGVWQEIERVFRPDMVVGASVGCLNGWMIASGASGEELAGRWTAVGSSGMLTRGAAERWIRDIFGAREPRVPFGLVTTELPRMRPRLHRWPGLTWQHLGASCALPLFLKHYKLNGHWHLDGGLQDPLPLWAAAEMGATHVVTVNLLAVRPWFAEAAAGLVTRISRFPTRPVSGLEEVQINPTARLGTLLDSVVWTRENAEHMIALGRRDAAAAKERIIQLAR